MKIEKLYLGCKSLISNARLNLDYEDEILTLSHHDNHNLHWWVGRIYLFAGTMDRVTDLTKIVQED